MSAVPLTAATRTPADAGRRLARLPFQLMAKPVGPRCNMACRYCFYLEKDALFTPGAGGPRMSEAVLEAYVRGVAEAHATPELVYAWQGGEPTLAGLDFFRRAVALQRAHAGGRSVANALQTNGLLLDDEWCAFLAEHGFLVGISIDGPRALHDRYRRDRRGGAPFDKVVAAVARMRRHGVPFNTLTVVNEANARRPLEVYRFLRELGAEHMQFIPAVERRPDAEAEALGLSLATPPEADRPGDREAMMPWSVAPRDYGRFLADIFDTWLRQDVGRVFVQTFEIAVGSWAGIPPGLCVYAPVCGRALVLEANGDVYACDHYVYPAYRRGNLLDTPLAEMVDAPAQEAFGASKQADLPEDCRACPYRFACNGGCLKHRFVRAAPGETPRNYLCEGYRQFFRHADPWLRRIAARVRAGQPADGIMAEARASSPEPRGAGPARNAPCPCGSGRKYKRCHGAEPIARDSRAETLAGKGAPG